MIALACKDINKSYGVETIIENITFQIEEGDRVGLVGVNGAGKSTLLKIIAGIIPKDDGDIYMQKGLTLAYLSQENDLENTNSIYSEMELVFESIRKIEDNLRQLEAKMGDSSLDEKSLDNYMHEYAELTESFEALGGYGYQSKIRGTLKGLGFDEDTFLKPINTLSGGQKTRVSLAKILLQNPGILLLDEPTNYLDIQSVEWLENYLKSYQGSLVIISHDRYFLDQVVNKVFEIENRKLSQYNGNYTTFIEKKNTIREQQLKDYVNQQREIERQQEIIRRLTSFGSEKKIKRARSREKMLERLERVEKPAAESHKTRLDFSVKIKSGNDVLRIDNLALEYPDLPLFHNVSFSVYKGEKVGIIGPNGIGKTTLFKALLGNHMPSDGEIKIGHNVDIGYYDQELTGLDYDNTVIEEIWDQNPSLTHGEIRNLLAAFLFTGDDVFKEIESLSGGEKSRLCLLKLMKSQANLLLMDEPTNHLDIDSKAVLEEALLSYEGTLIAISHDRYFLNRVCDKIIELNQEGAKEFLGNYSYYQEKKKNLDEVVIDEEENKKTKTEIKEERRKEKLKKEEEKKHKQMISKLEAEIASTEEQIQKIDELLCLEENYSNPDKSRELHQQSQSLKQQLEKLYEQWEEALEDN